MGGTSIGWAWPEMVRGMGLIAALGQYFPSPSLAPHHNGCFGQHPVQDMYSMKKQKVCFI